MIFHIAPTDAWEAAIRAGHYRAPSLDTEGFIHCSNHDQVAKVANVRFAGRNDLVLLCVEPVRLRSPLRYEIGEPATGERFPHLYGPLEVDAVVAVRPFLEGANGFSTPAEDGRL